MLRLNDHCCGCKMIHLHHLSVFILKLKIKKEKYSRDDENHPSLELIEISPEYNNTLEENILELTYVW